MRTLRLMAAAVFVLAAVPSAQAAMRGAGSVTATAVSGDSVEWLLDSGGIARIDLLAADVARVRVSRTRPFSDRQSGAIAPVGLVPPGASIFDGPSATFLATPVMTIAVLKAPFRVLVFRPDGTLLLADMPDAVVWDDESGTILARKFAPPDEHYFGLGARGGPIDRRGRSLFMKNVDWADYTEFTDPLYISIPFYYGVRQGLAYGVFLDNPAIPLFDMDVQRSGIVTFGALSGELNYYVLAGPTPRRVAESYARLTGFTPLPPRWSLGFHQSRYGYTSQNQLLFIASELRQRQIPCDVLYLDIDYMDGFRQFTWDPVRFPSPIHMNALLEFHGFKRINIIEPLVRQDDPLWPFLAASGFLLKDGTGAPVVNSIWFGDVSWIDFTKNAAAEWFKSVLQTFMSMGVSGTWNDLNEPAQNFMPQALHDFNGDPRTDLEARNLYALFEGSLTYAAQRELRPNVRPWSISRSGYSGIQRYTANWSGDAPSTFDSLRVSVQMSLSMGLSGQNQFGHDIGGFMGSPSPELFIRWMEFASFTPLFRNHAINTSAPREPWSFGEPYTSLARSIIEGRYRLLPYLYTVFEESSRTGVPVLAPLFFHFPSDAQTYAQDSEFMLGPALLVAPIVSEGATGRTVYLPAGSNWREYRSSSVYTGGQSIEVNAPMGTTPLFVREGAIVPYGPVLQYVDQPAPPSIDLDIYPGPDETFVLYEDDGTSFDYQTGVYLRTSLARRTVAGQVALTIQRLEGVWAPPPRHWTLQFRAMPSAPAIVTRNGVGLATAGSETDLRAMTAGWFYRAADRTLLVRIPDDPAQLQVVVQP